MRKRRGTVFVRPGKDVTLYVPSETPAEVIDYLNHLKREGMFSQGVMDIVTQYVQQRRSASTSATLAYPPGPTTMDTGHAEDSLYPTGPANMTHLMSGDAEMRRPMAVDAALPALTPTHDEPVNQKLDVAQIFLQAQRNSRKMNDSDS